LVVVFDTAGQVTMIPDEGVSSFDLSLEQDGSAVRVDWPSPATPWLAIDLDGDGTITSGRELFGTASLIAGFPVSNGFEALAALDDNGDGVVDSCDEAYQEILLWSDNDSNRVSTSDELQTLKRAGVTSLDLGYYNERMCDERENCGIERSSLLYTDDEGRPRTGTIVDMHLPLR
jgi:hypothetical protein